MIDQSRQNQNLTNHVALVLDASWSMTSFQRSLITVADGLIKYLAQRSQELEQETRITVYIFARDVICVFYDVDVLRLPSIAKHYKIMDRTALIDATLLSQDDFDLVPEKYGDHAFLTYVLTDGEENASKTLNRHQVIADRLGNLKDNRTVAILVPHQRAVFEAKNFGFPAGNIAVWDTTSVRGIEEVGHVVTASVSTYMDNRTKGIRSSTSVFSTGADALNADRVKAANLVPLDPATYQLVPVVHQMPIQEFVEGQCGRTYVVGTCFYQLNKSEIIQPQKVLYVQDKATGLLYGGPQVRDLIGLGHEKRRVSPSFNRAYNIFVQSTSLNRNLVPSTHLMIKSEV